ncbi:Uu.00g108030.m01.CDS01 [Anthostomella pinea]|uniref:Uu.00g108030.m01.CDS01 n=1 Tax=Anthostomella pinea TaxID=933095 RepID=A0AAI8VEY0_9PEZI|nr:Uu.00g108030.m01.CDS01 [Anthostomella pinea]
MGYSPLAKELLKVSLEESVTIRFSKSSQPGPASSDTASTPQATQDTPPGSPESHTPGENISGVDHRVFHELNKVQDSALLLRAIRKHQRDAEALMKSLAEHDPTMLEDIEASLRRNHRFCQTTNKWPAECQQFRGVVTRMVQRYVSDASHLNRENILAGVTQHHCYVHVWDKMKEIMLLKAEPGQLITNQMRALSKALYFSCTPTFSHLWAEQRHPNRQQGPSLFDHRRTCACRNGLTLKNREPEAESPRKKTAADKNLKTAKLPSGLSTELFPPQQRPASEHVIIPNAPSKSTKRPHRVKSTVQAAIWK